MAIRLGTLRARRGAPPTACCWQTRSWCSYAFYGALADWPGRSWSATVPALVLLAPCAALMWRGWRQPPPFSGRRAQLPGVLVDYSRISVDRGDPRDRSPRTWTLDASPMLNARRWTACAQRRKDGRPIPRGDDLERRTAISVSGFASA
jgi:hypothetical protein